MRQPRFRGGFQGLLIDAGGKAFLRQCLRGCNCFGQVITRARLYVAGLSYPYLYVNGHPVTDDVLNTDFTTYDKTVDYSTYDVTRLVRPGSDALAVSLGNGFYAGGADDYPASGESWQPGEPTLKLELEVWYADGTSAQVASDGSWKVTTGPTTDNSPAAEINSSNCRNSTRTVSAASTGGAGAGKTPGETFAPAADGSTSISLISMRPKLSACRRATC